MQTFQEMKHRRFFTEVTSLIMNSSVNFISVLLWLMHIYICLAFPFFLSVCLVSRHLPTTLESKSTPWLGRYILFSYSLIIHEVISQ